MSGSTHRRSRRPKQLELPLPDTWGGRRAGAGRKPAAIGRKNVEHRARAKHVGAHPLHVVLRCKLRSLRNEQVFPTVRRALARATRARSDFRILHFSVQADHLHLIVEAGAQEALSRGMQGLAVRVTRAVNRLVFRRGALWSGRYYARALSSPRAVKHAVEYVLNNFRKHGEPVRGDRDPCSSAIYDVRRSDTREHLPISAPRTWLGRFT